MTGDDFIESFMDYTAGIPTPDIFRLWSGIATVAGALERRVWLPTSARSPIYPNMYILLVAPPAIGKSQAIFCCYDLWKQIKELKMAPDNLTKASLIDALAKASRKMILNKIELVEFHSLLVAASEFGVFVPSHDLPFLNTLNHIYDNPSKYDEERRTTVKELSIHKPQLNILSGTQPAYLATLLPEEAWGMGFMSRVIMVYSATPVKVPIFGSRDEKDHIFTDLVTKLRNMSTLYGPAVIDDEAVKELEHWHGEDCPPVPEHSKLAHYVGRRVLHVLKLSIISAVSRTGKARITLQDLNRARDWLLEAEVHMPDVFRDMTAKSDISVIHDLHYFMWQLWVKTKKPIHEARIINFLQSRVPSDKVLRLIELAERSNIIQLNAGTKAYTPRPKHEFGEE